MFGQNPADDPPEVADPAAVDGNVRGKWIDLKNVEAGIKRDKSVLQTHAATTELSDGELGALWSFCSRRLCRLRRELVSEEAGGATCREPRRAPVAQKPGTTDWNCSVPHRLVNRVRLENIRQTVKQVTEAQIHEPSECPECQKKEAELAKIAFLRRTKVLMESALIQEKLEEQVYSSDVLTRIGEALGSFPKPSEDSRNLWQRLKGQKI